ncbi:hypothetical protein CEXT_673061 [Caerostris extrusa]|uniref:Uncharacterized protein n=1 Tax=Caerostris extrusa TaxID=172846 RepID=A0AAV4VY15_CAEEX|nr:hypothetical protein CEXT_673061 [Caerostris extrusa]
MLVSKNLAKCPQEMSQCPQGTKKRSPRHIKINEVNRLPYSGVDWNLDDCKQETGKISSRDITMPSRDEKGLQDTLKLMKLTVYQILVVTGILMTVSKRLAKCPQEILQCPQEMKKGPEAWQN